MSGQERGWTAAWTTSPQRPSAGFAPNWSEEGFAGQTIRQTVRLSIGGDTLRVRLSNRYGATPLRVAGLTVAPAIKTEAGHELTKDGNRPLPSRPAPTWLPTRSRFPLAPWTR
jgi:hypothetical protein